MSMTSEEKKQAIILSLQTLSQETANEVEKEAAIQVLLTMFQAVATEATEQLITAAVEARLGEVTRRIESRLASRIDQLSSAKPRKRKSKQHNSDPEESELLEFYRSVLNKVTAYTEKHGRQFRTYLDDADAYPLASYSQAQLRRTLAIIHRWDDEHPGAPAGVGAGSQQPEVPEGEEEPAI
ncbi:MAG: hypothetical protein MUP41_09485 [Desulfobacterales bacterium]|nr:hypothetical protein [Desulfobacterales bacterium]